SNNPLNDPNAQLIIEVLDPSKQCVLYAEQQYIDTTRSEGGFNINIGSNQGDAKRYAGDSNNPMHTVFENSGPIQAQNADGQNCHGGFYNPLSGDGRYFRIIVISHGHRDILGPDIFHGAWPAALVCESLEGVEKSAILKADTTNGAQL